MTNEPVATICSLLISSRWKERRGRRRRRSGDEERTGRIKLFLFFTTT